MQIPREIVHTYVSIHNADAEEVLNESHIYFTFGSHICSFSSMTNEVFLNLAVTFVLPNIYDI